MPLTWFGASWGAPINEDRERQATPTGEPCLYCREPIENWASGVITNYWAADGTMARSPQHLECFMLGTAGTFGVVDHLSVRHLRGLTPREAARAVVLIALEATGG